MSTKLTFDQWLASKKEKDLAFGYSSLDDQLKLYQLYIEADSTENNVSKKLTFNQWSAAEKRKDVAFGSYPKGYRKELYDLYVQAFDHMEKRDAAEALAKQQLELVNISTLELAKLTKGIVDGADLKDFMDVLPILQTQALQNKAVNEFLDDLSAEFRDAIAERVKASVSEQDRQIDFNSALISAKVNDLVATCIEMGKPALLNKLGIKDAGNFDGINKSKIGKTKKWDESH